MVDGMVDGILVWFSMHGDVELACGVYTTGALGKKCAMSRCPICIKSVGVALCNLPET